MNNESQLIFERYLKSLKEATLDTGTMSVNELKEYLMDIKGPTPVFVEVEAPVKMLQKNRVTKEPNPYAGTIKHSTINGMAGGDYEIGVMNRELDAHPEDPNYDPQFRAEPLWKGKGQRIAPVVIQHVDSGEYYLAIGDVKTGTSEYFHNGQLIDKEILAPYLPPPSGPSQKQAAVGISAENQKNVRYPLLKNIKRIKINNMDLQIT